MNYDLKNQLLVEKLKRLEAATANKPGMSCCPQELDEWQHDIQSLAATVDALRAHSQSHPAVKKLLAAKFP